MIKITFKDGQEKIFNDANYYQFSSNFEMVDIIKRKYDNDGGYDEDDDSELAVINAEEIRMLENET